MKLHASLIEELIKVYEVNSGWTEERKLKAALERLEFSVYVQENGNKVLVSTKELVNHMRKFNMEQARIKEAEDQNRGQ